MHRIRGANRSPNIPNEKFFYSYNEAGTFTFWSFFIMKNINKKLSKLVKLNLDNDIMQFERRVLMKRSLGKLMVKPQTFGCRINSALISVKHYKERLYRRRNVLSKAAKKYLEASYSIGCYPNKIERERIAKSCNLSPQQVRVWVCITFPIFSFNLLTSVWK